MARQVGASFEEQDAFTGWRKVMLWQCGEIRKIKRRANKRERRRGRAEILAQQAEPFR